MNKIITKLRTLGRLLVWVSLSFGMAIATSQTANAWRVKNGIDDDVYFIKAGDSTTCDSEAAHADGLRCDYHDGSMSIGETMSCMALTIECGWDEGQDIMLMVPLDGPVRLVYPPVHVTPHGELRFERSQSGGLEYTLITHGTTPASSDTHIPLGPPICQEYKVGGVQHEEDQQWLVNFWAPAPAAYCEEASDRHRVP